MKFWQLMQLTQNATMRLLEPAGDEGSSDGMTGGGDSENADKGTKDNADDKGAGDGDKKPSDREAKLLAEVMEKKGKLKELSTQNEELTGRLTEIESKFKDIDVEQYQKMLSEAQERRERDLESKEDWATLKAELEETHQSKIEQIVSQKTEEFNGKLTAEQTRLEELQAKLNAQSSLIEELTVGNEFGNSKYIADETLPSVQKMRVLYGAHFDVVDGKVVPHDKPRGADKRTPLVDGDGKPLRFDSALQKIVEADPDGESILRGKQRSGSDSDTAGRQAQGGSQNLKGLSRIANSLANG